MTNGTTKSAVRLISALALVAGLGTSAMAEEITSMAILTPETGTDFGWNQQGIDGAKAAGDALGVDVIIAENLGYGDVRPTLRELAEEEPGLIIAHASGYNTAAPEIGAETGVKVAIVDSPSALTEGTVVDYTASGHEGAYLAGVLAAKMTRSGTVGIVTSGEPPSWNSQSAAFAEGVKATNPELVIRYAVIGPAAYSDAAGGKRVTESLIAAGADIIFGQGNGSSFGMLQAVETTPAADGGKVMFIDVIGDKTPIDKGYLLSSVLWNLTPIYEAMIEDIRADKFGTRNYGIKLADGSVALLKSPQIPDDVWAEVMVVKDQIVSGDLTIEPKFDAESVHALVTGE